MPYVVLTAHAVTDIANSKYPHRFYSMTVQDHGNHFFPRLGQLTIRIPDAGFGEVLPLGEMRNGVWYTARRDDPTYFLNEAEKLGFRVISTAAVGKTKVIWTLYKEAE